jgi:peptide/nickel transport system substrate-binding protein
MKQFSQTQSVYERNPFFWGVDSAGNQLPYFDQIVVETLQDKESYNLRIVAGQLDYASTWTSLSNLPLYVDNAQKGGYNVYKYKSPRGSDESFTFNRNSKDPVLAKIFQDPRWSQAISYGTNRKEVQDVVFLGTGVIRQAAPNPDVSYFKKEWETFCVEYNVDKANQLLDEMGLKKGADGVRVRPDGKPLSILIELTDQTDSPTLDVTKVVVQHWEKLGLKVTYKVDDRQLLQTRGDANEIDCGVWHTDRTNEARALVPNVAKLLGDAIDYSQPTNLEWYRWWQSQGKQGQEPPEEWKAYFKNVDDWHACTNDADYKRLATAIFDFVILKHLRVIGTVGFTTWPIIVKNTVGNVPKEGFMGDDVGGSRSLVPEAWFRKA